MTLSGPPIGAKGLTRGLRHDGGPDRRQRKIMGSLHLSRPPPPVCLERLQALRDTSNEVRMALLVCGLQPDPAGRRLGSRASNPAGAVNCSETQHSRI